MIDAAEKQEGVMKRPWSRRVRGTQGTFELVVEHECLRIVAKVRAERDDDEAGPDECRQAAGEHRRDNADFRECCRYVASHSQPLETQGIRPTLDELKADYDAVLKAREPHKG